MDDVLVRRELIRGGGLPQGLQDTRGKGAEHSQDRQRFPQQCPAEHLLIAAVQQPAVLPSDSLSYPLALP
ncbi:unnamed protein product [Boreogadus saida]